VAQTPGNAGCLASRHDAACALPVRNVPDGPAWREEKRRCFAPWRRTRNCLCAHNVSGRRDIEKSIRCGRRRRVLPLPGRRGVRAKEHTAPAQHQYTSARAFALCCATRYCTLNWRRAAPTQRTLLRFAARSAYSIHSGTCKTLATAGALLPLLRKAPLRGHCLGVAAEVASCDNLVETDLWCCTVFLTDLAQAGETLFLFW